MLRIGLVGAVESTAAALEALAGAGHAPVILLTLPLEKRARHSDFVDLAPLADAVGTHVERVQDVNDDAVLALLATLDLDLLMVVGWSRVCGPEFRRAARLGAIGYHPALLPSMRGRAALAWTILRDVRRTGGSLFWLDEGIDSGDIVAQEAFDLSGAETLRQLYNRHLDALRTMAAGLAAKLAAGERPAAPQRHEYATYLAVRRAEDGAIDWERPAPEIERLTRAVSHPYPGAFTWWRGRKLIIWAARVAHYPQWAAQIGQVFTYEGEAPVARCGGDTDLVLSDYQLVDGETGDPLPDARISGQPRLGARA